MTEDQIEEWVGKDPDDQRQAMKRLTQKDLRDLKAHLTDKKTEIDAQLKEAQVRYAETGEKADADWYGKATYASKRTGQQISLVCEEQGRRKRSYQHMIERLEGRIQEKEVLEKEAIALIETVLAGERTSDGKGERKRRLEKAVETLRTAVETGKGGGETERQEAPKRRVEKQPVEKQPVGGRDAERSRRLGTNREDGREKSGREAAERAKVSIKEKRAVLNGRTATCATDQRLLNETALDETALDETALDGPALDEVAIDEDAFEDVQGEAAGTDSPQGGSGGR